MTSFLKVLNLTIIGTIVLISSVTAQDDKGFNFSAKIYYDYMHGISTEGPRTDGSENQFMFRRAYLTINKKINDTFSARYRIDADRKAGDDKLRPFLKHLYLQWNNLLPSSKLYIGMSGTPTWGVAEAVWGYRGLSKTVWDKFKDVTSVSNSASSAAVGLALKGSLSENVMYHSMVSNGGGYSKGETDHRKKLYTSVSARFSEVIVEGYVDYEAQETDNNLTYKGFAGYQAESMAAGLEYYHMIMGGAALNGDDMVLTALSAFGRLNVSKNGTVILRYDMYEPDADIDDNETGLIIAAFDYRPGKGISVIPNINYFINGGDAEADLIGYLTFVWSLK